MKLYCRPMLSKLLCRCYLDYFGVTKCISIVYTIFWKLRSFRFEIIALIQKLVLKFRILFANCIRQWTFLTIHRFQLSMRTSCPYPYANGTDRLVMQCSVGPLTMVASGLVYSTHVTSLLAYTKYEFQLNVWNQAGAADQPAVTFGITLPAGKCRVFQLACLLFSLNGFNVRKHNMAI